MAKSYLVAFCLVIIGMYGALYVAHAGRSSSNEISNLTSQVDDAEPINVDDLQSQIDHVASTQINDLGSQLDEIDARLDELDREVKNIKLATKPLEFERGVGR